MAEKDAGQGGQLRSKFSSLTKFDQAFLSHEESASAQELTTEAAHIQSRNDVLPPRLLQVSDCCIYKVHSHLRSVNAKEYDPVLISIGPYHHGKPELREMEKYKVHYLELLLERSQNSRYEDFDRKQLEALFIDALCSEYMVGERTWRPLDCYLDTFYDMDLDGFGKMLLHDASFIVQLFVNFDLLYKNSSREGYKMEDPIMNVKWMGQILKHDLLLFENQLPIFVLRKLFGLTVSSARDFLSSQDKEFDRLALQFFHHVGKSICNQDDWAGTESRDVEHLLALAYTAFVPSITDTNDSQRSFGPREQLDPAHSSIRSAKALEEVGIKFCKTNNSQHRKIFFSNGELSMPRLRIDGYTESFFRNLVAYEQYSKNNELHILTDFLQFMDCLINSSKDVELLRHAGIIDNKLGDDEKVAIMFNKLCTSLYFNETDFSYARIFRDINEYCGKRRNVWMAKLWHQYFNSPWSLISFIAAVVLLVLTALQTGYTMRG